MTTGNPGCVRRAACRKARALSAVLLLTTFGCTPQPSSKTLGWGPPSPGMRGEESPSPHHSTSNKVARAASPPRAATAADAGTSHAAAAGAVALGGDGQKTPSTDSVRTGDPKAKPTAA